MMLDKFLFNWCYTNSITYVNMNPQRN
uniref:Uncharacterized protein n=1 Tax=Arundo donax TaxID=35708 RepID=A0A0A9F183_ARUDO